MFTEDLSVFVKDFGIEVEFKRAIEESSSSSSTESSSSSGESSSSSGPTEETVLTATLILDQIPSEIDVYDRAFFDKHFYKAGIRTAKVTLLGIAAELDALERNDYTTINSIKWFVIGRVPDGTGMATLILSQSPV